MKIEECLFKHFICIALIFPLFYGCGGGGTYGSGSNSTVTRRIIGKLSNAQGAPLSDVEVIFVETNSSAQSDKNGNFEVELPAHVTEFAVSLQSDTLATQFVLTELPQASVLSLEVIVDEALNRVANVTVSAAETAPEVCTAEYQPVCGIDGKTYANACEATVAGVQIADQGPCSN